LSDNTPDLAVLMPFRNARSYASAAIESVLSQSYSNFMLFAIDDRSEDGTSALISAVTYPRLRVLRANGRGVAAALNTGLAACQGYALVARQDTDDVSLPERFTRQYEFMAKHPEVDVVATQATRVDQFAEYVRDFPWTPTRHAEIVERLKETNPICHGSVMFRRERAISAGGYNEKNPVAEGYELWVRMAESGARFASLSERLYLYRLYNESWSRSQPALTNEFMERVRKLAQRL
jgi:glycosyltransferase involved in cell wall biosynthesis